MNGSGLSKSRLARMRDVMAATVERGEVPGLVTGDGAERRGAHRADRRGRPGRHADPGRHDLPPLLVDQAVYRRRDDGLRGGVQAAAGRAGGPAAARTGRPRRAPPSGRPARRHRAGLPGGHRARPAHLCLGPRHGRRAARHSADPVADPAGDGRPGAEPEQAGRDGTAPAGRVAAPPRHGAADAPARRRLDVPHRLGRARRADRARHRAAVRPIPARADLRAAADGRHGVQGCPLRLPSVGASVGVGVDLGFGFDAGPGLGRDVRRDPRRLQPRRARSRRRCSRQRPWCDQPIGRGDGRKRRRPPAKLPCAVRAAGVGSCAPARCRRRGCRWRRRAGSSGLRPNRRP